MKYAIKFVLCLSVLFGFSATGFAACADTGGWYDAAWHYRKLLCVDKSKVPGDLTGFTVYFPRAADADLSGHAQADGDDILFTLGDGTTKIAHELEYYSAGTLRAWIIRDLSTSVDTPIYMYFGNAAASAQQSASAAWDTNFKCVHHFGDGSTLSFTDPKGNCNGTNHATAATSGQVGGAALFNGTTNYIETGTDTDLNITGAITLQAWIDTTTGNGAIFDRYKTTASFDGYGFDLGTGTLHKVSFWSGAKGSWVSGSTSADDGVWHLVAVVINGTSTQFYIDGATDGTTASQNPNTFTATGIGSSIGMFNDGSASPFNGKIDELKVAATNRSGNWMVTSYNNEFNPGTFFLSIGPQTSNGTAAASIYSLLHSQ